MYVQVKSYFGTVNRLILISVNVKYEIIYLLKVTMWRFDNVDMDKYKRSYRYLCHLQWLSYFLYVSGWDYLPYSSSLRRKSV